MQGSSVTESTRETTTSESARLAADRLRVGDRVMSEAGDQGTVYHVQGRRATVLWDATARADVREVASLTLIGRG